MVTVCDGSLPDGVEHGVLRGDDEDDDEVRHVLHGDLVVQ